MIFNKKITNNRKVFDVFENLELSFNHKASKNVIIRKAELVLEVHCFNCTPLV